MHKLALFASGFGAAALLCCYALPLDWLVGLSLVCVQAALLLWQRFPNRARAAVLLLAGLGLGFGWFRAWTGLRLAPAQALAGTTSQVRATVTDYPTATDYGWQAEVRLSGIPALLYTGADGEDLRPGDQLSAAAALRRSDLRRETQTTRYTSQGYLLLASARGPITYTRPAHVPVRYLPRVWAHALLARIPELFPEDVAGLTAAVLLGDRSLLTQDVSTALSRAGLAHATAVSGLHVGFLAQLLMLLCHRRQKLAAALILPALICFTLATGAHPSTVRALVMQAALICGPLLDRRSDSTTSLGLALLLLLLWNPYTAANAGFQLSFAAVAGIRTLVPTVMRILWPLWRPFPEDPPSPVGDAIREVCLIPTVSLGAAAFTAPLSAVYFGTLSLAGVLANLLCLWAVSGMFALSLPAVLAGLLSPTLGTFFSFPARLCARWVLWMAEHLGKLAFAALPMSLPCYRMWLGAIAVLAAHCFLPHRLHTRRFRFRHGLRYRRPHWRRAHFRKRPKPRTARFLTGAALLLCAAVGLTRRDYARHTLTLAALDVGQGSATAFLSQGRAVLVDCGGNRMQNAGDTAADWFQTLGVDRLDLLVLTHFDNDHFNGVEELFKRLEIGAVAIPHLSDDPTGRRDALYAWAAAEGSAVTAVSALTQLTVGGADFTLYPPLGSGSSNETGLSLLCTVGDFDALVTGDADASIESALIERYPLPDLEVLAAGHHGSAHSTSPALLSATAPDIALISVGENGYGHPDPSVLDRLSAAGAAIYRTDVQGTVVVTVD